MPMERNVSVSCPEVMSEGFTIQGIYPGTIWPHPVPIIPVGAHSLVRGIVG
jgi:hypothetical protein